MQEKINFIHLKLHENIFNYRLKNEIISLNSDIYALHFGMKDMEDEVAKRQYPFLVDGEVLIKLD